MNKMNKKGFTLIEMLVVIAIIAILVAIIIPVVSAATERAAESRDAANIRAAIAEVSAEGLAENADKTSDTITLEQSGTFDYVDDIGGKAASTFNGAKTVTVKFTASTGEVSFEIGK